MRCQVCNEGNLVEGKKSYFIELENCYVIIKKVPCYICDHCGEAVFSQEVLDRIDLILKKIDNMSRKILITDYANAA
ncbi:MAG: type II toxin-antitoxin system MqsA family antitoxin [Lachnospiraceae bacterium]|nr:type II toxin-antitoxin system MqsA family antitoxin [Lachnospiraceae bacterium]